MQEPVFLFNAMHIFQGICAVLVLGLAIWLAYTIIRQQTAEIGQHKIDDAHRD
jgi:ABC-type nickel/cobalt efflux system permease component RcnA